MHRSYLLLFVWLGLVTISGRAENPIEEEESLALLFKTQNVTGTFAVLDARSGKLQVHDAARAQKRFIPASTFKIPNTVIGLETGAVKSVDEVLPYGGKPQFLPEWEHDMGLREAIRLSAVPIYQELARRVGLERMRTMVRRLEYGNGEIGGVVDRFWLDGPLEISAVEQVRFLQRLAKGDLPVSKESIAAAKEITKLDSPEGVELHGKTGWCMSTKPEIGWWVGWVEREGQLVATFALNIDINEKADAAKRIPLAKACLMELGILPAGTAP